MDIMFTKFPVAIPIDGVDDAFVKYWPEDRLEYI